MLSFYHSAMHFLDGIRAHTLTVLQQVAWKIGPLGSSVAFTKFPSPKELPPAGGWSGSGLG